MSVSCPRCGLKLSKFEKRPAANETVQCPQCSLSVTFRTKFGAIQPLMVATIFIGLIVGRVDGVNKLLVGAVGIIVAVGLGVVAIRSERLEIARKNTE